MANRSKTNETTAVKGHEGLSTQAFLAAIVESSDDAIYGKTLEGNILSWNHGAERMYGYSAAEIVGRPVSVLVPPIRADEIPEILERLKRGERVDHFETVRVRKNGETFDVCLNASPVRDASGKILGAFTIARDITERKRAVETLRQLSGRLLRLQDQERRRIARELHDSTAQRLAALAMNLSGVMKSAEDLSPRARTCLSESLELAEECSLETRTLAYLLHPPLLDEVGLGSALRWFVDGYTQRTGIHLDLEMPLQLARLPEDIELALYRVIQEGLTNIHLHSGSKKAHLCLKCNADQAVLTVADEGRGLPPGLLERGGRSGAKLGVGISGMRERIRQLGGQFEIDTGSKGTTLRAIVPLGEHQT